MGFRINLEGKRVGKLTVLSFAGNNEYQCALWKCVCDCGNTTIKRSTDLKSGLRSDCGCVGRQKTTNRNYKHGHSIRNNYSPTYETWRGMLERCTNPNNKSYERYGGMGILVCEEWKDFQNFLQDMGERPEGKTLDRINPFGNYTRGNCRWATPSEQALNRRWQHSGENSRK